MFKRGATLDSLLVVACVAQKSFNLFMGKPPYINQSERPHKREIKILMLPGLEIPTKLKL